MRFGNDKIAQNDDFTVVGFNKTAANMHVSLRDRNNQTKDNSVVEICISLKKIAAFIHAYHSFYKLKNSDVE
jgi:hypothetical protein